MAKINLRAFTSLAIDYFPRRSAFRVDNVSIDAGQADCVNTAMTKRCQDVGVNFSGEDHLRHFQRVVVSDATAFDDCLLDAEFFRQFAQLFPAAMNDADSNADLLKQGQFFAQRDQSIAIFRHFAREFHDERLAFEALNVRQRFTQKVET